MLNLSKPIKFAHLKKLAYQSMLNDPIAIGIANTSTVLLMYPSCCGKQDCIKGFWPVQNIFF